MNYDDLFADELDNYDPNDVELAFNQKNTKWR